MARCSSGDDGSKYHLVGFNSVSGDSGNYRQNWCVSRSLCSSLVLKSLLDAGLVGLVLSYGLTTTGSLNWAVRTTSEVEQNIVSVERILHYVELKPEAPDYIPEAKPLTQWPSEGHLEFRYVATQNRGMVVHQHCRDYCMRYRPELDLVLRDISLDIVGVKSMSGGFLADIAAETSGEDWHLWSNWCV